MNHGKHDSTIYVLYSRKQQKLINLISGCHTAMVTLIPLCNLIKHPFGVVLWNDITFSKSWKSCVAFLELQLRREGGGGEKGGVGR